MNNNNNNNDNKQICIVSLGRNFRGAGNTCPLGTAKRERERGLVPKRVQATPLQTLFLFLTLL